MKKHFNWLVIVFNRYRSINLPLIDQALVSAVGFFTNIILARFLGLEDFGRFSLAWMIVMFANTLQSGLILAPMITIGAKQSDESIPSYFGAVLLKQLAFSSLWFLILWGGCSFSSVFVPTWNLQALGLPLAFAAFAFQLQDFIRRYCLILGHLVEALINDVLSYVGQLVLFLYLLKIMPLTSENALWVIAGTSMAAFLFGMLRKGHFSYDLQTFKSITQKHWHFGSWLTLSNLVQWGGTQGMHFIAGVLIGTKPIGVIRAINNLTAPMNIFIQGVQNILPVQAGKELKTQGQKAMVCYLLKATGLIGILFIAVAVLAILFRQELIHSLYGQEYVRYDYLVIWQGIYVVLMVPIMTLTIYFRTIEKTRVLLLASSIAAPVTLGLSALMMKPLGAMALFVGAVINEVVVLTTLFAAFAIFYQKPSPTPGTVESHESLV